MTSQHLRHCTKHTSLLLFWVQGKKRSATTGRGGRRALPNLKDLHKRGPLLHGLTNTTYALTLMSNLRGIVDMERYKYIFIDNYSYN